MPSSVHAAKQRWLLEWAKTTLAYIAIGSPVSVMFYFLTGGLTFFPNENYLWGPTMSGALEVVVAFVVLRGPSYVIQALLLTLAARYRLGTLPIITVGGCMPVVTEILLDYVPYRSGWIGTAWKLLCPASGWPYHTIPIQMLPHLIIGRLFPAFLTGVVVAIWHCSAAKVARGEDGAGVPTHDLDV